MTRGRLIVLAALAASLISAAPVLADAPALFKGKCAACHGPDGSGNTPMGKKLAVRALGSPEVQKQSDAVLLGILTKGKGKMPSYGGKIPDPDLAALVAHVRSFGNK